jgi:transposase
MTLMTGWISVVAGPVTHTSWIVVRLTLVPDLGSLWHLILEDHCEARGFRVLFLPKLHCELNFIGQCWDIAKRIYLLKPRSTAETYLH